MLGTGGGKAPIAPGAGGGTASESLVTSGTEPLAEKALGGEMLATVAMTQGPRD